MANNPPISNTQSLAQTVVMSGAGGQSNPSMDALIQLLTRKLSAEQDAEDLATSQAKAAQKANADSLMQAQKVLEAQQANCTHTKPGTNRTALAGQKTPSGPSRKSPSTYSPTCPSSAGRTKENPWQLPRHLKTLSTTSNPT